MVRIVIITKKNDGEINVALTIFIIPLLSLLLIMLSTPLFHSFW